MLTGSGFSILPAAYHRPAPATGTVHSQPRAAGQHEGGQPKPESHLKALGGVPVQATCICDEAAYVVHTALCAEGCTGSKQGTYALLTCP